jgi:hypothetical protein
MTTRIARSPKGRHGPHGFLTRGILDSDHAENLKVSVEAASRTGPVRKFPGRDGAPTDRQGPQRPLPHLVGRAFKRCVRCPCQQDLRCALGVHGSTGEDRHPFAFRIERVLRTAGLPVP